jgi:hypothetical protein
MCIACSGCGKLNQVNNSVTVNSIITNFEYWTSLQFFIARLDEEMNNFKLK